MADITGDCLTCAERALEFKGCRHTNLDLKAGHYQCGDCGEGRGKHLGLCPDCGNEHTATADYQTALLLARRAIETGVIADARLAAKTAVDAGCTHRIKIFTIEAAGVPSVSSNAKVFYLVLMVERGDLTEADLEKVCDELSTHASARFRAPDPPGHAEPSLSSIRLSLTRPLGVPDSVATEIGWVPCEE